MASTIVTKNSSTASAVPVSGDLTQGELAVNVTDKRLFTKNSGGTVVELGTNPSSLTMSGGTANGVAYLNGSKVVTTGSALTFDGTNLGVGMNPSGTLGSSMKLFLNGTSGGGIESFYNNLGGFALVPPSTGAGLIFYTFTGGVGAESYSEQMRLTSTGLGIGTSSPGYKLDVNGTARISTYLAGSGALNLYGDPSSSSGMQLSTSGNLGLGVTPSAWLSTRKVIQNGNAALVSATSVPAFLQLSANTFTDSGGTDKYISAAAATNYAQVNGQHQWFYAASGSAGATATFTQAMTLDASGNLLVGDTALTLNSRVYALRNSNGIAFAAKTTTTSDISLYCSYTGTTGTPYFGYWVYNGNVVGSISATASTTSYNTSSDYRLKNTIAPMTGALAKVAQLKPVTYKWNADGSDGEGFIAHELAEVVPQCVTGEKDAVDAEGNPVYQGIDTSFLVATLTAAIQEQQALITQLTERITALEGK